MRARQEYLRSARLLAHIINIGTHPFALAKTLARQQLVAARNGLGSAKVDDNVAKLDPLDEAVDDLSDPVLEFEILPLALRIANLLNNHLLCSLRSNPAKIDRRQRIGNEVADLGFWVEPLRIGKRDLGGLIFNRIGDFAEPQQPNFAIAPVNLRADVILLSVFRTASLLNCLLHCLDHLVAIDAFV